MSDFIMCCYIKHVPKVGGFKNTHHDVNMIEVRCEMAECYTLYIANSSHSQIKPGNLGIINIVIELD